MIHGESNTAKSALDFIRQSTVEFTLTGSRFFGNFNEESDWDFFTEYNETIVNVLLDNGFNFEGESYKDDPVIVQVYKRENVHVQLVNDVRRKRYVQRCLYQVFRALKPSKEHAKLLWLVAMKLYSGGYDEGGDVARRLAKK